MMKGERRGDDHPPGCLIPGSARTRARTIVHHLVCRIRGLVAGCCTGTASGLALPCAYLARHRGCLLCRRHVLPALCAPALIRGPRSTGRTDLPTTQQILEPAGGGSVVTFKEDLPLLPARLEQQLSGGFYQIAQAAHVGIAIKLLRGSAGQLRGKRVSPRS